MAEKKSKGVHPIFIVAGALVIVAIILGIIVQHQKNAELAAERASQQAILDAKTDEFLVEFLYFDPRLYSKDEQEVLQSYRFQDKLVYALENLDVDNAWETLWRVSTHIKLSHMDSPSVTEALIDAYAAYLAEEMDSALNSDSFDEITEYCSKVSKIAEMAKIGTSKTYIRAGEGYIYFDATTEGTALEGLLPIDIITSKVETLQQPLIVSDGNGGYYDTRKDEFVSTNKTEMIGVVKSVDATGYAFYGDIMVETSSNTYTDTIQDNNTAINQSELDKMSDKVQTLYCNGSQYRLSYAEFLALYRNPDIKEFYAGDNCIIYLIDSGIGIVSPQISDPWEFR